MMIDNIKINNNILALEWILSMFKLKKSPNLVTFGFMIASWYNSHFIPTSAGFTEGVIFVE